MLNRIRPKISEYANESIHIKVFQKVLLICMVLLFHANMSFAFTFDDQFKQTLKDEIYLGFQNGPDQSSYEYPIDKNDWLSIVNNHPFDNMGVPHVSWKTSSTLVGLWYAYQATDDYQFLYAAYNMIFALLNRRDHLENRPAWNGKIYPLRGANSRYHGATFPLYDKNNVIVGEIEFCSSKNGDITVFINPLDKNLFNLRITRGKTIHEVKTTLKDLPSAISKIDWLTYQSPYPGKKAMKVNIFDENSV